MIFLTEKNWIEPSFVRDDVELDYRRSINDLFHIKTHWNDLIYPTSFRQELARTAQKISEALGPVVLAVSGGMDSEVMTRAFLDAKRPFRLVSMRYWHDGILINQDDQISLQDFTMKLGVNAEFLDIDIIEFCNSKALQIADTCKTTTFITTAMAYLIEQSPLPVVIGAGDPILFMLHKHKGKGGVYWGEGEYTAEWFRIFKRLRRQGCPGFFYYTQEMMAAFLLAEEYLSFYRSGEDNSSIAKQTIYQKHFEDLTAREPQTGCENFDHITWMEFSMNATRKFTEMKFSPNYNMGHVESYQFLVSKIRSHTNS